VADGALEKKMEKLLATEEQRLLRDNRKTSAKRSKTQGCDVNVVDGNLPFVELDETKEGRHDTRFWRENERMMRELRLEGAR